MGLSAVALPTTRSTGGEQRAAASRRSNREEVNRLSSLPSAPPNRRRWARALLWTGVILAVVVGAGVAAQAYYGNLANTFSSSRVTRINRQLHTYQFRHRITILLMGSSLETSASNHDITAKNARNRTDTMMLVSIDPATHQVGVLSIPRDSRVDVPQVGLTKIAEASFFGGLPEAVQVVERSFHIPVDYYAYLSMFQFPRFINDMGGLSLCLAHSEVYQPSGGKLGINLPAGCHHLNGWQVLAYTRFRQTAEGDISRIQQQQRVLRVMARQLLRPAEIPQIPALVRDFASLVTTNLNLNQMLSLALFARHVNLSAVRFGTVPGHASTHYDPATHAPGSFWTYDPHLAALLIQNVLLGAPLTPAERASLKIAVLSGTSVLTPAQNLANQLKAAGYTVTDVGWANTHHLTVSTLINTTGDRWLDTVFTRLLGPTTVTFVPYHTTPWDLEITVGSDYRPATVQGS
jgi:LCP family protein required for cell wall assembly